MSFRPLFLAVPTALVAVAGFAWLTSATAFDGGFEGAPQVAQAAPPVAPPPATGGGPARGPERGPGRGPERGPQRDMRPAFSPQKMCVEQVARKIGARAYLKAMLDLKPEQMQAWNAFEKAADEASAKDKARCASLPTEMKDRPNFADRYTQREEMMKARLDSIEAVKPSLLALYASLTPDQKQIMDRPMMMGGPEWRGRRGRG